MLVGCVNDLLETKNKDGRRGKKGIYDEIESRERCKQFSLHLKLAVARCYVIHGES